MLKTAPEIGEPVPGHCGALEHVGRIRYLARHGWSDPIELDVGVPCLGYDGPQWPVTDGNHRLWAAALRGDVSITVDVAGQADHAAMLLGVPEAVIVGDRDDSGWSTGAGTRD